MSETIHCGFQGGESNNQRFEIIPYDLTEKLTTDRATVEKGSVTSKITRKSSPRLCWDYETNVNFLGIAKKIRCQNVTDSVRCTVWS